MKKYVTIKIDENVWKEAKKRAIDLDKKFSEMVEELLVKWLEEAK